jgi:rsbT co-antagonist protein RsbR
MLFISWTEPHEFSEQAVRFYETIATLATPTIANLRLLQQQTEQLAFNQSLFEAFIDNFPALVFAKDTEGKIILANKALEAFFDRPKDELLGKTVHDLASKEAADAIWASEEQVIRNNETSVVEEYAPRPDGTVSARLSTKFPIRDAEGNATGVGGVAIDISEQKAAQAALEEAMQTSADIVSAIPSGLFIYQYEPPDQLILMDANPAAEELTGIALVDWLGREFNEIWADATERGVIDEYLKVAQTGEIYEAEEVMYEGNRVASAILTRVFPMPGDRIGVAFEDVTDQKTSEVERARLQEDIIEAQQRAIQELSTPIIPVMEGIIVMPVVGNIDTQRARQITRSLLAGVSAYRVNIVILDLTGVSVIDSGVANHLNKTIMAARLKGAQAIITGISDAVAESVVDLGIDWGSLETFRDLQTGLIAALANVGFELKKRE